MNELLGVDLYRVILIGLNFSACVLAIFFRSTNRITSVMTVEFAAALIFFSFRYNVLRFLGAQQVIRLFVVHLYVRGIVLNDY